MGTSRNAAMALAVAGPQRGLIRTALAGVTPQLISLIAALLLARMLSSTIGDLFVQLHAHALGAWSLRFLVGFGQLLAQAAPMVVGIVAAADDVGELGHIHLARDTIRRSLRRRCSTALLRAGEQLRVTSL